jgi:hypothetical protein
MSHPALWHANRPIRAGQPRARARRGGFLLLEAALATLLLAIGLFAIIEAMNRCLAAAISVQNQSMTEIYLANKAYEFKVERPDDYLDQEGVFDDNPAFAWRRQFQPTETEGLWVQTITVYWQERGQPASDSLVEYRYLPQKVR